MLRSGGNPEYIKELARFVDQKMVELAQNTPTVDTLKIAILTALSIADEYLRVRDQREELERAVLESGERIQEILEPALDSESH